MTFAEIADHYAPKIENILTSPLPRPRRRAYGRHRRWALIFSVLVSGIFVHQGVPLNL